MILQGLKKLEERMNKEEQEHKQFLEQQLEWCKKQDRILEEIEVKLFEMKKIAQFALEHELSEIEIEGLNTQLIDLKNEVHLLKSNYRLLFIRNVRVVFSLILYKFWPINHPNILDFVIEEPS